MGKLAGLFGGAKGGGGSGSGGRLLNIVSQDPNFQKRIAEKKKATEVTEVESARRRAQSASLLRKGRRASILTSGRGITDPLGSVKRPQARAS